MLNALLARKIRNAPAPTVNWLTAKAAVPKSNVPQRFHAPKAIPVKTRELPIRRVIRAKKTIPATAPKVKSPTATAVA